MGRWTAPSDLDYDDEVRGRKRRQHSHVDPDPFYRCAHCGVSAVNCGDYPYCSWTCRMCAIAKQQDPEPEPVRE